MGAWWAVRGFFDRAMESDDFGRVDDGPPQTLFNIESLVANPQEVIFVDSEADVLALIECDVVHGVFFNGPVATSGALHEHSDLLKRAKRIMLAGTHDRAGATKREDLAARLGRQRCHTVIWPKDCTSAAQTLQACGVDAVQKALAEAKPYPIDGLYQISAESLLALRSRPSPATMTTGTGVTDEILHLPTEGRLIVVTGYPAGGKTSWLRFAMVHTANYHDRRWAVFSPEMMPWEHFCADCSEVISGKPFWPYKDKSGRSFESMSMREIEAAGAWLEKRLTMIVCDSGDEAPTLKWVLDRAIDAIMRDGVTDVLLDPWNEVEHTRDRNMSETDYIGRSLQQIKAMICQRHGVNAWIIAHPTKPYRSGDGNIPPPGPYEISGSSHWANKSDLGITIHSMPPRTELVGNDGAREVARADLHIWKARFRRFGMKNTSAAMDYDQSCGRYYSTPKSAGNDV